MFKEKGKGWLAYGPENISETLSHASFLLLVVFLCSSYNYGHKYSGFLSVLGLTMQLLMLVGVMWNVFYISDACSDY